MITQLSPLFSRVSTEVKPEDILLQKGAWVYFSPLWPGTWKWASGKIFEVSEEPILVTYPVSYILPGSDYKDLDSSNSDSGLKLYPEDEGCVYEAAIGFKPGDYMAHIYVPKDKYVYSLAESTMYPNVDDATKKYVGAKWPSDSPHTSPLLFFYFIKDGPAIYLRPYVLESVTFEKVTVEFHVNKCKLSEIANPTADMIKRAKRIAFYTELTGY